jgi:hypothetical protein
VELTGAAAMSAVVPLGQRCHLDRASAISFVSGVTYFLLLLPLDLPVYFAA